VAAADGQRWSPLFTSESGRWRVWCRTSARRRDGHPATARVTSERGVGDTDSKPLAASAGRGHTGMTTGRAGERLCWACGPTREAPRGGYRGAGAGRRRGPGAPGRRVTAEVGAHPEQARAAGERRGSARRATACLTRHRITGCIGDPHATTGAAGQRATPIRLPAASAVP